MRSALGGLSASACGLSPQRTALTKKNSEPGLMVVSKEATVFGRQKLLWTPKIHCTIAKTSFRALIVLLVLEKIPLCHTKYIIAAHT